MDNLLVQIVGLVKQKLSSANEGSYVFEFAPDQVHKELLIELKDKNCIQEINSKGQVIDADKIVAGSHIKVEVIQHGLQHLGFYHDLEAFINNNEFSIPEYFYIRELDYLHHSGLENEFMQSYFAIIHLIDVLIPLALFHSKDDGSKIYLMQDKSAVALPLIYNKTLIETHHPELENIEGFVADINGHSERKKIYIKELIDFISDEKDEGLRFSYLYENFNEFYSKCEAAYAFFLSDFSYSKLKLELESAILDYSKNIRAIINDSQTKLIAIPAAFIVASSQLNLESPLSLKNLLLIISSFIFSTLIEIFIRNQKSSLNIFVDNVKTYKTTFQLKNTSIVVKEMRTLQSIINQSFKSIDDELANQVKRLRLIRYINWGMSIFLIMIVVGLTISAVLKG